jgi:DNA-binding MarR family transcriptional regulator
MAVKRRRRGTRVDYQTLAELRHHIRRFQQVREESARAAGIEAQQYVALLQLKALQATSPATIGALAERLLVRHHSVVELVDRLEERGMVRRRRAPDDRRGVHVELRPAGEAILRTLALYSMNELRKDGPALVSALSRLLGRPTKGGGR